MSSITITSVSQNGSPPVPTGFTVSGQASTTCEAAEVSCSCSAIGLVSVAVDPRTGDWTAVLPNDKSCSCGAVVTFEAICKNDGTRSAPFTYTIICCPDITPSAFADQGCDSSGNRIIQFQGTVDVPSGPPPTLYWDYGDSTQSGPFTLPAGLYNLGTNVANDHSNHKYATQPSNYVAALNVFTPAGCARATWQVGPLQACPSPCDPVTVNVSASAQGCAPTSATVNISVQVTGATPTSYNWTVRRDNDPNWKANFAGPLSSISSTTTGWTGTGQTGGLLDLSNADSYHVSVSIEPLGCPGSADFTVPLCDACPKGSDIRVSPAAGSGNCADGKGKSVTFDFTAITNANASAVTSYQWDFGDPASGASNNVTTTTPNASHTYQSPGSYTVRVTATVPPGCPPNTYDVIVTVQACSPVTTGNGGPGDGGPGMSCGCWVLLILALGFSIAAAVFAAVGFCTLGKVPPNATVVLFVIAIVLLLLSIICLVIWYFVCVGGKNCKVLNQGRHFVWGIIVAGPLATLISGLVSGYFVSLGCGIASALSAALIWAYWGLVLTILDAVGTRMGCVLEKL